MFVVTGVFGREIDPEVVELFDDPDDPDLPMACGRRGRWLRKTPLLDEAETEVRKKYVNFDSWELKPRVLDAFISYVDWSIWAFFC